MDSTNQNTRRVEAVKSGSARQRSRSGIALNHYMEGVRDSRTAADPKP